MALYELGGIDLDAQLARKIRDSFGFVLAAAIGEQDERDPVGMKKIEGL